MRGHGFVEAADYEAYVNRLADAAGHDHAAPEIQRLRQLYRALWADMAAHAGTDRLSRDEYVRALHDSIVTSPTGDQELFTPLVSALVAGFDLNDDGVLDRTEYTRWMTAYGLTTEQAAESFTRLDLDSDNLLSTTELTAAFHEFYRSADPAARGTWLLGPLPALTS